MKFIGVAGGSGSGKTTYASMLAEHIGLSRSTILLQDSYYKDHSRVFKGDGSVNFDHPDALDWELMIRHLQGLRAGQAIEVPIYNFATHSREDRTVLLNPCEALIIDGILIYSVPELVKLFDLKVFIETPETVRFERRLRRDVVERGRTKEGVITQYQKTVLPMHNQFVEPSKTHADLVVPGDRPFIAEDFLNCSRRVLQGLLSSD